MITDEQRREDEAAYAAAFDEEMAAPTGPSEGESFGIDPAEEAAAPAAEPAAKTESEPKPGVDAVALAVVDGDILQEKVGEKLADATTSSAEEDMEQPADPKEIQRQKSWEGRLRAREEELARREAELKAKLEGSAPKQAAPAHTEKKADAIEQAAEQLEADGDSAGAERVEAVADKVESGELSAEQAMSILSEDFGPEFVKMIKAIAVSQAEEAAQKMTKGAIGQVQQSVQEVIDSIVDEKARSHFEMIADRHPDFTDVASLPEFAEFSKNYPDGARIAESGTAREIIKMLDKFKESSKPAAAEPNPAMDAAEGVRSAGLRLPEAPVKAEGYEDAWKEF